MAKRGNACRCPPVPMRHKGDKTLPAWRLAIERHQIGFYPSFINDHTMVRGRIRLACTPFVAGVGDIRAVLIGGAL